MKVVLKKLFYRKRAVWELLPGMLLLSVWPFAAHRFVLPTRLVSQAWFSNTKEKAEFFLFARGTVLQMLAVWMLLVLFLQAWRRKKQGGRFLSGEEQWIFAGGMVLLILLSTMGSPDITSSLRGSFESYETLGVLLSYVAVFLYFCQIDGREWFLKSLLLGAILQGLIGVSQMLGKDFWRFGPGAHLLLFGTGREVSTLRYSGNGAPSVYLSFYNSNYAGVYCVVILPIAIGCIYGAGHLWEKACAAAAAGLMAACLWGSGSKAGVLTMGILLVCLIFWLIPGKIFRKIAGSSILAVVFLAVLLSAPESSRIGKIRRAVFPEKRVYALQKVETLQEKISVTFDFGTYDLWIEEGHLRVREGAEEERSGRADVQEQSENHDAGVREILEEKGVLADGGRMQGREWIRMEFSGNTWEFCRDEFSWKVKNRYGKTDLVCNAQAAFGKGYEKGFTNRMYIWSRTIPVLKDCLLLGKGGNTFTCLFPQNDYVTRANMGGAMQKNVITKPHSMYLQVIAQTGLLSLGICLGMIYRSLRRIRKNWLGRAVWFSSVGFLIMGFSNDAMVVTLPFSIAILAIGRNSR